ncbi:hypothetical protein D3C83_113970 [compost metagenome]
MVAADRMAGHRLDTGLYIHHLLALLGHGDGVILIGDEAMTRGGGHQQLAARDMHEDGDQVGFGRQVDEAANGLPIAAPAGQL